MFCLGSPLQAKDYWVHHQIGSDDFDGLSAEPGGANKGPFRTILHALKTATAGDTVHLVPTAEPYHESVLFNTHPTWSHEGGKPGNPVIVDGHGAVITGAEPCPPEGWELWRDRIYLRKDFPETRGLMVDHQRVPFVRYFNAVAPGKWIYDEHFKHLLINPSGKIGEITAIFPSGKSIKIKPEEWKQAGGDRGARRIVGMEKPAALIIDGVRTESTTVKENLRPGEFSNEDGILYYHLPAGKEFADLKIECVVRGNGVGIAGATAHVIIRNLHTQKVYNDGYNIHGKANNLRFENIIATDCFDEGFSAHSDVQCEIEGGVFLFNASGVTSVGNARIKGRNIVSGFNDGPGYVSLDHVVEDLENVILIDNDPQLGAPHLTARNVVSLTKERGRLALNKNTVIENMIALGPHDARIDPDAGITLRNIVITGPGEWHIRGDEPRASFGVIERVRLSPDLKLTYGSAPPFKSFPLGEWLSGYFSEGVTISDPVGASPPDREKIEKLMPADPGNLPALLKKAFDLLELRQDGDRAGIIKRAAQHPYGR